MSATNPSLVPTFRAESRPTFGARVGRLISLMVILLLFALLVILFKPPAMGDFSAYPSPAASYAEAVQRIETMQAAEIGILNPDCTTQFMTHGASMERAIVLIHGYTNCPAQFTVLGEQFYDRGYNVLIAPLPFHGHADRMTSAQGNLTAELVIQYADDVVDIAQGLGDHVTVAGLSLGGTTAAWIAQSRSDVDLAVLISPAFGYGALSAPLTQPAINAFLALPDTFSWWNVDLQEAYEPSHQYPRASRHALMQVLRLGYAVRASARLNSPAARSVMVITNPADTSVRNEFTADLVETWQSRGVAIITHEFDAALGLRHDIIDPAQPYQQVDVVYPLLLDWITNP